MTRDAALAASPRIPIDTPELEGSLNLKGAQLDDLKLLQYRETISTSSPNITLLNPSGAPNGYFIAERHDQRTWFDRQGA